MPKASNVTENGLPGTLSDQPFEQLSDQPSEQLSKQPSKQLSDQPSEQSSKQISEQLSDQPSEQSSEQISEQRSDQSAKSPSDQSSEQLSGPTSVSPSEHPTIISPSLFPMYLSYSSQHKLLNLVQRILEDCCYYWAMKWNPDLLKEQNWSCPEAVELGVWATVFAATTDEALVQKVKATSALRHAAVHRVPTNFKGLRTMIEYALSLAKALQDPERIQQLERISVEFRATVRDLTLHKGDLKSQLLEELRDIDKQRKALDEKAIEAKSNLVEQDREKTATMSSLLERSIENLTLTAEDDGNSTESTATPTEPAVDRFRHLAPGRALLTMPY